ncbi:MAG: rhomboid family intramembrane serine protease [Actinomycetota bacterium]
MRPASVGFQCPDDVKLGQATQRAPRTTIGTPLRAAAPIVTWSIIALNVAVYVASAIGSVRGLNQNHTTSLFRDWLLLPQSVAQNDSYYRLLTATFLHYGLLHLAMNMLALFLVGPYLERLLGPWRYVAVYMLAALGGSVAVYAFGARFTAVVGASGAIFGLFAAALLLVRELGFDPRTLIGTIVINFVLTFSIPDISKLGHLGGFLLGGFATMAIAGIPGRRRRIAPQAQLLALGALAIVLLIAVVWRTAVLTGS